MTKVRQWTFIFPLWKQPKTKEARPPVLTLWPITAVLLFSIMLFCPPLFLFLFFSFFHPSVSGNEARIRVRIQAPWQSSACCVRSRAGLCHSPWARLMIADGQGINWSSEGVGQSSYARRRGSPGTLFVGPLHLLAAAGFSPALTESTGLCLDA